MRRIAKQVMMSGAEKKYSLFVAGAVPSATIGRSDNIYVYRFMHDAAIYPTLGDNQHSIDGYKYRLLGLNFTIMCAALDSNSRFPLDIYIVRQNARRDLTSGVYTLETIFPQTQTTDTITWPRLPCIVGPLDKQIGRIVARRRVWPKSQAYPNDGVYRDTAVDTGAQQRYLTIKFYIPINRTITKTADASAYPVEIPYHVVMYHSPHNYGTTAAQWSVAYAYTQSVFKDM